MRFVVVEKVRGSAVENYPNAFAKLAGEDVKYKVKLQKEGKIVAGGPVPGYLGRLLHFGNEFCGRDGRDILQFAG